MEHDVSAIWNMNMIQHKSRGSILSVQDFSDHHPRQPAKTALTVWKSKKSCHSACSLKRGFSTALGLRSVLFFSPAVCISELQKTPMIWISHIDANFGGHGTFPLREDNLTKTNLQTSQLYQERRINLPFWTWPKKSFVICSYFFGTATY